MISKKDLKRLAELRLKDSACLLENKRYQAAKVSVRSFENK